MTDVRESLRRELEDEGLPAHEVGWLLDEFLIGGGHEGVIALRHAAHRRLTGEPLQYIIGHWPFRGLDLDVDPRALIPRPETEELVDHALRALAGSGVRSPSLLDLGVGTGAIGLSLLDELRGRGVPAHLIGIDLSREALDLATHNAKKHGLMSVTFCHGSWYQPLDDSLRGTFDLITANPPYIGEDDFASLDPVLRHEPRSALVAASSHGVPGLADIAHIIDGAPQWLRPGGSLVLEHGFDQRDAVLSVARAAGATSCEDWDDMAGNPRILVATW